MKIAVYFSGHESLSRDGRLFEFCQGKPESYYTSIFANIASSLPTLRFFTLDQVSLSACRALMIIDLPSRRSSLNSLLCKAKQSSLPVILVLMESFLGRSELFNASNLRFASIILTYDANYCHFLRTSGVKAFCYLLPSVDRSFDVCANADIDFSVKSFFSRKPKAVFVGGKKSLGFLGKDIYPYSCLLRGWIPPWLPTSCRTKSLSSLRNRLVSVALKRDLPIDVFGSGWPCSSIARFDGKKSDLLNQYRLSICIENYDADGYVTEKIVDAMSAGAFPVYSGSNSVYRLIPGDLFLKVDNLAEMLSAVEYLLSLDPSWFECWWSRCLAFINGTSLKSFRYFDLASKIGYAVSTL